MDERYMRDMRGMDGRRLPPRNSRGEFMSRGRGRGRRGDRGMGYGDMRDDMRMRDGRVIRSYPRMDYGEDMRRGDMGGDIRNDYPMDGHYPQGQGATYYPIQAMGTFEGYYGMPEQDYGRGRRDYGMSDYRGGYGRRDYGDYGYDYGYDYGEDALSKEELKEWEHKLMGELDEREKQMFKREIIIPKFKQMGIEMKDFTEDELYVFTLAKYLDHKHSIGQNPDLAIKIAKDNLCDQDIAYQGSMYLMKYFDTFVEPRD